MELKIAELRQFDLVCQFSKTLNSQLPDKI